jgi:RNA 3'-terminal phosphate cyclase (ATP)
LKTSLIIKKFGYYPKGMGEVILNVYKNSKLTSVKLDSFGEIDEVGGISVCTFLEKQKVAERQAETAKNILKNNGYNTNINIVNDHSNPLQKGSSLVLWVKTKTGVLLGGDAIGELRKSSEAVGREAAENLLKEIRQKATVDEHLADMLVPYIALANGKSTFLTRELTEHLETNIWLVEKFLDTKIHTTRVGNLIRVETVK